MFHYANLSDFEFELLCRDIMERKIGCPLRCFAPLPHTALQLKERTPEGKTETAAALLCLLWEKADGMQYF